MKNIPDKIYLQIGDDADITTNDFNDLSREAITWDDERINDNDIEYELRSKQRKFPIFGVSRYYSAGVKAKQKFEKEMLELKNVLGENCEANERVSELIEWYRGECDKRPEIYKDDEIVINAIKQAAMTGLNFNLSLMEAYRLLKISFEYADHRLAMG